MAKGFPGWTAAARAACAPFTDPPAAPARAAAPAAATLKEA